MEHVDFEGLCVWTHAATYLGIPLVPLSRLEVCLLRQLASAQGRPVPRRDLLASCWSCEVARGQKLDVAISRLRERLTITHLTVRVERGIGYRIAARVNKASGTYPSSPSILVVEDDLRVQRGLVRLLPREARIECAVSFASAAVLAPTRAWAGAILDIRLPDGNGLDLIPLLRAKPPKPDILVVSGCDDRETINRVGMLGAQYCVKPIDVPFVRSFVNRALEQFTTLSAVEMLVK